MIRGLQLRLIFLPTALPKDVHDKCGFLFFVTLMFQVPIYGLTNLGGGLRHSK